MTSHEKQWPSDEAKSYGADWFSKGTDSTCKGKDRHCLGNGIVEWC